MLFRSDADLERLIKILEIKHDLHFYLGNTSKPGQHILKLRVQEMQKFVAIIHPHMLPIFMYKLGLAEDGVTRLPYKTLVKASDSVELLHIRYLKSRDMYVAMVPEESDEEASLLKIASQEISLLSSEYSREKRLAYNRARYASLRSLFPVEQEKGNDG